MGHGILTLTQRGSPHGRRAFGSGRIGIDLNEGKDRPQDMCPPCALAQPAVLGRGAVYLRENLLRMSSDHSVLLSKTLGNSVLEL